MPQLGHLPVIQFDRDLGAGRLKLLVAGQIIDGDRVAVDDLGGSGAQRAAAWRTSTA